MTTGIKKSGGDVVLESRHLVGLFLLMVVIFGVVFTLGYLLGRSQNEAGLRIPGLTSRADAPKPAPVPAKTQPAAPSTAKPAPGPSDWDFYRAAEPNKPAQRLEKPAEAVEVTHKAAPLPAASKAAPKSAPAKNKTLENAPLVPKGATLLQVAALTKEGDALALAEALQQKRFPAFVLAPGVDHYYRVQVGPYADEQSVNIAKRKLESEGFKTILRR